MKTKDYKSTKKEVEDLVNNVIMPSLKAKYEGKNADMCNIISMITFFYSVGRISALESLLRLAIIDLTGEDNPSVKSYFVED